MRKLRVIVLAASCLACSVLGGCGQPKVTGVIAPEKPLGQAEQALLKQIEDTPAPERQKFMLQHRMEVMQFSTKNRAFGERLNQILGVKPQ